MNVKKENPKHRVYSCFKNTNDMENVDLKNCGYIYIASNQSFIGNIVKIGMTTNAPDSRIDQLSCQTSIPFPFKLECVFQVNNCKKYEKLIHLVLKNYKISKNKEFFDIPWFAAVDIILSKINFYQSDETFLWVKDIHQAKMIKEMKKLAKDAKK